MLFLAVLSIHITVLYYLHPEYILHEYQPIISTRDYLIVTSVMSLFL